MDRLLTRRSCIMQKRKLLTLKNEAVPPRFSDLAGPLNCAEDASGSGNGDTLPPVVTEKPSSEEKPDPPPGVTEYWLNVQRDGTERKFAQEPLDCLTLHVWVYGDREYTATFHRVWFCDGCLMDVREPSDFSRERHRSECTGFQYWETQPSGKGWRSCKNPPPFVKLSADRPSSCWWRKAVRS